MKVEIKVEQPTYMGSITKRHLHGYALTYCKAERPKKPPGGFWLSYIKKPSQKQIVIMGKILLPLLIHEGS